ncbi:MAG: sugar phosphate isomerase/epimerase family protein [Flavobacteriaceae bacterium]
MERRKFIQNSLALGLGATALGTLSANTLGKHFLENNPSTSPFFKLSLAQWSLHNAIQKGDLNPYDFAAKAKELGFEGIEYVNQLYKDVTEAKDKNSALKQFIAKSNAQAKVHGVENILIMIDGEGDLAVPSVSKRNKAIENHKTWVEVAAAMGCHSIRINLFGERDEQAWKAQSAESMRKLGEFAAPYKVNIVVENHGYLSSNAALVMEMLDEVNQPNCGTLPDFGNFCLERKDGERWGANCVKEYDRYKGVEELMPRAFAVSAKSHDFDAQGNETNTDYLRMLKLVKSAGYNGFIGVEYEGSGLSEVDGILATKNLLLEKAKLIV